MQSIVQNNCCEYQSHNDYTASSMHVNLNWIEPALWQEACSGWTWKGTLREFGSLWPFLYQGIALYILKLMSIIVHFAWS